VRDRVDGTSDTVASTPATDDTLVGPPSGEGDAAGGAALVAEDRVGRYQIVELLGSGGMGRVYRARDPDLGRDVAIKVLHRAGGGGELERRLLREARAVAQLSHPNLVAVHDVGTARGQVFIAFELIDGSTLTEWMRQPGRTLAERLRALADAGRGLAAAHAAGVIHRDFKPDNVLVARSGVVKVVDFGLAGATGATIERAGDGEPLPVDLTMTGAILGTPAYMAPEQHRGAAADERTDQFGFAVSAWESLYGERPFRGVTMVELATATSSGDIAPPPEAASVPGTIEGALRRALSVDPAARFPDLPTLLAALVAPRRSPLRRWLPVAAFAGALAAAVAAFIALRGGDDEDVAEAGVIERAQVQQVIKEHRGDLARCYAKAEAEHPGLGRGVVAITFEIAPNGSVNSTRIDSDDFEGGGEVAICAASASLKWTFPPPKGGGVARVSYPFEFAPAAPEVTATADGAYRVPSAALREWLKVPDTATAGVQIVPSSIGGQPNGYKLYAIQPGSAAGALGFVDGDTITHVDAIALTGAPALIDVVAALSASPTVVKVQLRRRGALRTHVYTVE
jgi:hypothetical protein